MTSSYNSEYAKIFEADDTFEALMQMQRRFLRQIKQEQQRELELQASTARSLGSVVTTNVVAVDATPHTAEWKSTSVFPARDIAGTTKRPLDITPPVTGTSSKREEEEPDPKKMRTFSKFDFDEIYFSLFEPEGEKERDIEQEQGKPPAAEQPLLQPSEEGRDDDSGSLSITSIFRQEDQPNDVMQTTTPDSDEYLASIVTDDDNSEDGYSENLLSGKGGRRSSSDSLSSVDPLEHNSSEHRNTLGESNTPSLDTSNYQDLQDKLLESMKESIESHKELADWNDEMKLNESFITVMAKSAESRSKVRALFANGSQNAAV